VRQKSHKTTELVEVRRSHTADFSTPCCHTRCWYG
jgi:hypothetical protein